jgi:hypothetical protein
MLKSNLLVVIAMWRDHEWCVLVAISLAADSIVLDEVAEKAASLRRSDHPLH